ncbi:MAG: penicillin-binding protein 2 [bacterium]
MRADDPFKPEVRSRRAWQLAAFIVAGALVLAGRLFHLQVLGDDAYRLHSERNRIRLEWVKAPRGLILDRHGEVLADSRPSFTVRVVPRALLANPAAVALLSQLLEMSPTEIEQKLAGGVRHLPRVLRRDVGFDQVSRIAEREEELPGVSLDVSNVRSYPRGALAAHVIGHVGEISETEVATLSEAGYRAGDFLGRTGLERKYESRLRGKDGERYLEVDVRGRSVGEFSGRSPVPPVPGASLQLWLDAGLQARAESLLVGRRGAVCFLDVESGGVLALASAPTFDLNLFSTGISTRDWESLNGDPALPLLNRAVQASYAPGSTFKMISFALTLEQRIAGLHQVLETPCFGSYRFGNRTFRCWEAAGHGSLDLEGALIHSCDVYFYQIAERTDVDHLAEMARDLGLGTKTGIDLPQELSGNVPTKQWLDERYGAGKWTRGTLLNLIIGQGEYLVTPLQMARHCAALANGGRLVEPRLVWSIVPEGGEREDVPTTVQRTWDLPERTLDRVRTAMEMVVLDDEGTGRVCRVPGYMPAAKTGTAENPHGAPHSWFVGYAPADHPEVAFAVIAEGAGHGSEVAAPIARKLLEYLRGPLPPAEDAS